MEDIGIIPDEAITIADIARARGPPATSTIARAQVLLRCVCQRALRRLERRTAGLLGVSFGDTIAMYKDTIRRTAMVRPNIVRYVEQSTLIHELCTRSASSTTASRWLAPHKDPTRRALQQPRLRHVLAERRREPTRDFAINRLLTGNSILFDDACLADVDAQQRRRFSSYSS